jgi:hypothetical protein
MMLDMTSNTAMPRALSLLLGAMLACSDHTNFAEDTTLSTHDSLATAREFSASLAAGNAPGAQTYSYRGLYAGLTRTELERKIGIVAPTVAGSCVPLLPRPDELSCAYDARLPPDSAALHLDVVYAAPLPAHAERMAREITATRDLPLDVDGVRLAQTLADAFERQTALFDRREASYGPHVARVQMGTVNGAHLNYVDINVTWHVGREQLVVKMSRAQKRLPTAGGARAP